LLDSSFPLLLIKFYIVEVSFAYFGYLLHSCGSGLSLLSKNVWTQTEMQILSYFEVKMFPCDTHEARREVCACTSARMGANSHTGSPGRGTGAYMTA